MTVARLIAILIVLSFAQGCVITRANFGEAIREEALAHIQKGITPMTEVVALIGAPDRIIRGNDREIFHYYYYDAKSPALILFLINFIRMDVKSDNLYVFFNKNGIAEEVVYSKRTGRTQFRLWPFGD